ncbi:MbtH domain protein [Oculatella sp. LEGE 06141]|uniref:MbtH domain protein n=1 Tax=Oculatella sp. LEGE 06141 TaxID=1828648 RepID=UPI001881AB66|nr:MbtH domain protein [Oculatella sp. LEGE 06141]MBE9178526.1 MbtH domain protein [Oculatella sp. LEGE 06141]
MNELVQRLSQGNHPVEVELRPQKTVSAFKACLERGNVHVRFTQTQGGTELGVRLDHHACDWSQINGDRPVGSVHLVGELTLNYVRVRCIADIDLETLAGTGHLEPIAEVAQATAAS